MNRKFFAFKHMGAYKIVDAAVSGETTKNWFVVVTDQRHVFGGYAFIKSEVSKDNYHGFSDLQGAINWIKNDALDTISDYARVICSLTNEYKKIVFMMEKLTDAHEKVEGSES